MTRVYFARDYAKTLVQQARPFAAPGPTIAATDPGDEFKMDHAPITTVPAGPFARLAQCGLRAQVISKSLPATTVVHARQEDGRAFSVRLVRRPNSGDCG